MSTEPGMSQIRTRRYIYSCYTVVHLLRDACLVNSTLRHRFTLLEGSDDNSSQAIIRLRSNTSPPRGEIGSHQK